MRTAIGWNCSFLPHYEAYHHIPKTPTWQLLLPAAALPRIARYCLKSFSIASLWASKLRHTHCR
jgi:hypothetical protein